MMGDVEICGKSIVKSSVAGMAGFISLSSNEKKRDKNQGERKLIGEGKRGKGIGRGQEGRRRNPHDQNWNETSS